MLERDIQKSIIDYLRFLGWFVVKNNTTGIYKKATDSYIPNTAKGQGDLTILKDGRVIILEVKNSKGKQSENQIEFQNNWERHGGEYYVVRSLDDVDKIIKTD